jgi:hypothetical protein
MRLRPFHRLGKKLVVGGGALLLGWTGTGQVSAQNFEVTALPAPAQEPAPAAAPGGPAQRTYLNKNVIKLPIQINDQARALISEIQLFVKDHPGAPWKMCGKVGPAAEAHIFQVPRDGEYWFTMVTMDKQGRGYPSDLRDEPPGLVVHIDTQAPQIELTNLGQTPEGQLIQCEVRDPNLDNARTKFQYQGGDRVFRMLEPVVGRPNVFCIPVQAVCTGLVRATAEDLAGNQALREVHVSQIAGPKAANPLPLALTPPQASPLENVVAPPQPMEIHTPVVDLNPPVQPAPNVIPKKLASAPPESTPEPKAIAGSDRPNWKDGARVEGARVEGSPREFVKTTTSGASPVQATQPADAPKRQFVNNTKVFLDYQVENAGPNGAGKIEVWITRDRAKSWNKVSEETQRNAPVEVQFPGDGIFGVTLIASNGRGTSSPAPAAGDAPDWWIEVDTAKPTAQITRIQTAVENGQSVVHIHWSAQDKNLADGPVDLSYAATPLGPWLSIAKGLKSEGQYRWTPPVEIGVQAHLRLIARDLAGNMTIVAGQDPVQFEPMARPRALIRSVTTASVSPMQPATQVAPPVQHPIQIVQPDPR